MNDIQEYDDVLHSMTIAERHLERFRVIMIRDVLLATRKNNGLELRVAAYRLGVDTQTLANILYPDNNTH